MPMVEIDETELVQHRTLADTVKRWMGNPDARKKILEAQKVLDPNAIIPELDAAKPINDALTKMGEELSNFRKEVADERASREEAKKLGELRSTWDKGRIQLREQGYTEEGLAKIEKLMEERGIADHDAGAALFDRINPPEIPVAPQNSGFDMFQQTIANEDNRKALFDNPDQWAANEVGNVLKEIRNGGKR